MSATTRTGGVRIGFRRGGSEWQQDLPALARWALEQDFAAIDLGRDGNRTAPAARDAGLDVGTVDLADPKGLASADPARREEAVARNADYIAACGEGGPAVHFAVLLPEDPGRARAENFADMLESVAALAGALEAADARIAVEGWPGPGSLVCTPETFRALFEGCGTDRVGVNYDPSHLVRMGIDPLRFLREFVGRVFHVHAKDTALPAENRYAFGTELPATFAPKFGFGAYAWRYCLPGHGIVPWIDTFTLLADAGYEGVVSIELEDANFNGTEEGEQRGLVLARQFLEGC